MTYLNARWDDLERETRMVLEDSFAVKPGEAPYHQVASCGCERIGTGDMHLCQYHMGYDSGIDVCKEHKLEEMRARFADGKEEEGQR